MKIAFALLLSALPLQAQQAATGQRGVAPKNRAPVSDSVLRVRLPRPQEAGLANGIHLIVLEDRRTPQVSFTLSIPGAGGYFDPADAPGTAMFTAAMVREGTTTRSSARISEQLESMAATFTVNSGMSALDATVFGSSLTEYFEQLLTLTADVLLHPAFAADELARYRQQTQASLTQQRSSPGFLATERMARVMYGDHPAGRVAPTVDALNAATPAALSAFHRARYRPDHATLAIAGDISFAEARRLVESRLGSWQRGGIPRPRATDPPAPGRSTIYMVHRPASVQTSLRVSAPAIARTSPDYDVLQMVNKVIGGGPTGRLFIHLREDKGYTYGAYSNIAAGEYRGEWTASTDVRSEVTEPALRDLLAEVTTMRDTLVPEKEFREQQRALVAAFALSLESPQQMLSYYTTSRTYGLPADYWDRYPERVMAITREQVREAARKYLGADRLQIVAVGDSARIAGPLRGFGPVEVFDTEGRPQRQMTP